MEKEVGGGIGMGNTCKPMAVSFQCMTKFTTNKKKKRKSLIKTKKPIRGMCMCAQLLSCVQLFATPWTVAHQAPLSKGFSWQNYWRELLFPSLGDLPDPDQI